MNEEQYNKMTKIANFSIGDNVKVLRSAKAGELGWPNDWQEHMDKNIGKTVAVKGVDTGCGVLLSDDHAYPWFVLEKVEEKVGTYWNYGADLWIIAQVRNKKYCLINIKTGNRWDEPVKDICEVFSGHKDEFTQVKVSIEEVE